MTSNLTRRGVMVASMALLGISISLTSCKKDDEPAVDCKPTLDDRIASLDLQGIPSVTDPADNASSAEKVALGRLIFWDPIVGGMKDMACATCHHPDFAYTDGLDLAIGVNGLGLGPDRQENAGGLPITIDRVPRNSPTVLNAAYNGMVNPDSYSPENAPMFWDSRKLSFEEQCQGPPASRSEMRGDAYPEELAFDSIMARLASIPEYVTLFDAAFGGGASSVVTENYAKALGAFERTLVTDNSPYLRYLGGELDALTDQQKEGLLLFNGKAQCVNCHSGPMMSDYNHHAVGVVDNPDHPEGTDSGKDELYKFRTPSLHNVAITGPYMHNGMLTTLEEAVVHMASGISDNENVTTGMLDPDFESVDLTDSEVASIVAFLESLTDTDFDTTIPSSVPSGLPVGGSIQ
ncbi:MAG: cytochrome-c peroxidase [Flavobacteriales bacterium]|nr:cytochrome-c peroxidase [Flavobacteriales bacterium]